MEERPSAPGQEALPRNGKLLKIGDFAKLAGTNLRTLRYYEELGLLAPAARSSGGFRYYRAEDTNRLDLVHSLQALGLELGEIKKLMDTRAEGLTHGQMLARVHAALDEQGRLLDERIQLLALQKEKLAAARAKLRECETCSHHPSSANNFCQPCQVDGKELPEGLSALF
jgi:DNA-binding transcriptional MerR regulator